MLSALRAYPGLRHQTNLRGWLLRIAERKALDAHRAAGRRPIPVEEVPERPAPPVERPDPALWRAVRRLPGKQRAAVTLRFAADLDYAAIGTSDRVLRGRGAPERARRPGLGAKGVGAMNTAEFARRAAGRRADRRGVCRRGLAVRPPDRRHHGRRDRQRWPSRARSSTRSSRSWPTGCRRAFSRRRPSWTACAASWTSTSRAAGTRSPRRSTGGSRTGFT